MVRMACDAGCARSCHETLCSGLCASPSIMTSDGLTEFAQRYAKAWCSQNPESVAAFFAENGSISINNGPLAMGRAAIAKEAQAFMTTFPDMIVTFDKLEP